MTRRLPQPIYQQLYTDLQLLLATRVGMDASACHVTRPDAPTTAAKDRRLCTRFLPMRTDPQLLFATRVEMNVFVVASHVTRPPRCTQIHNCCLQLG